MGGGVGRWTGLRGLVRMRIEEEKEKKEDEEEGCREDKEQERRRMNRRRGGGERREEAGRGGGARRRQGGRRGKGRRGRAGCHPYQACAQPLSLLRAQLALITSAAIVSQHCLFPGKCALCSPQTFYLSPVLVGTSRGGALCEDQSLAALRDKGRPCLSLMPCVGPTARRSPKRPAGR